MISLIPERRMFFTVLLSGRIIAHSLHISLSGDFPGDDTTHKTVMT